jgi:hypothetical protein
MKLLTFIAGSVSGVAVTLWWGGRKKREKQDISWHYFDEIPPESTDCLIEIDEGCTSNRILIDYCIAYHWCNGLFLVGEKDYYLEHDVLRWAEIKYITRKDLDRLVKMGLIEWGSDDSLADTQPIRTSDV